jgi:AcrR family transcriptional regulator
MARPPQPARRPATLAKATDYVLAHGLAGLSLRPLAAALGTSTRMLLYDFGSKQRLVAEVLAEARRRLGADLESVSSGSVPSGSVQAIWAWVTAPEQGPYLRLFFEVYVDAMVHPDVYTDGGRTMVMDWLELFSSRLGLNPAQATVRGLLLDRLVTGDKERTDAALARFAGMFPG